MKIFVSWSGKASGEMALALRSWLPGVIQSIEPFVSSEDIQSGARWNPDLARELEDSAFGIVCVTSANAEAAWIQFEAGALSKSIDTSRVVPLLLDLEKSDLQGPLAQFQAQKASKDDIGKLVHDINSACEHGALDEAVLTEAFDLWWPKLDEALTKIEPEQAPARSKRRPDHEVLGEVLELVRGQQQRLQEPDTLLPPDYLRSVLDREDRQRRVSPQAIRDLSERYELLRDLALERDDDELTDAVRRLETPISYLQRRVPGAGPQYFGVGRRVRGAPDDRTGENEGSESD